MSADGLSAEDVKLLLDSAREAGPQQLATALKQVASAADDGHIREAAKRALAAIERAGAAVPYRVPEPEVPRISVEGARGSGPRAKRKPRL